MSDDVIESPTQQGNEWLKPVDPNEGERKWAQYAAAVTPPRRSEASSVAASPQASLAPRLLECTPPASIDLLPVPKHVSTSGPPSPPSVDEKISTQLYASIDGRLVPVRVTTEGSIVAVDQSRCSEVVEPCVPVVVVPKPQYVSTPPAWPTQVPFEPQNAWLLLHQQQQLLLQLQQQQAMTAAALVGMTKSSQWVCEAPTDQIPSEPGLSAQGSSTVTPTVAEQRPRNLRQEALMQQLKSTSITLPPPPPPPPSDKPFVHTRKKSKSQSLEALMNSLQYTDLLTPTYSSKETQSEAGIVVETSEDESQTPFDSSPGQGTPLGFTPGYKKKPCRAFFSGGCRHADKCLFSHAQTDQK